eukprot:1155899-Pelagomonas_calceolata.AAC.3
MEFLHLGPTEDMQEDTTKTVITFVQTCAAQTRVCRNNAIFFQYFEDNVQMGKNMFDAAS